MHKQCTVQYPVLDFASWMTVRPSHMLSVFYYLCQGLFWFSAEKLPNLKIGRMVFHPDWVITFITEDDFESIQTKEEVESGSSILRSVCQLSVFFHYQLFPEEKSLVCLAQPRCVMTSSFTF